MPLLTLERDYAISYVLAGLSSISELGPLHFKGGTLLRKILFRDYRFSEDLDFSSMDHFECAPLAELLARAMVRSSELANEHSSLTFSVSAVRQRPHPQGQCEFKVVARFPWHRSDTAAARLKLEVAMHERLYFGGRAGELIHDYDGEELRATINCYDIGEVITEKLRAFVQVRRHLEEKGWVNPRARDLYDLWWLTTQRPQELDWAKVRAALEAKAKDVNISFEGPDDFRDERVLATYERVWGDKLAPLLVGRRVPEFSGARAALDAILTKVFA